MQKGNSESLQELLQTPEVVKAAVAFAAATGALTTLKPGAIAAQPKLADIEELASERMAGG